MGRTFLEVSSKKVHSIFFVCVIVLKKAFKSHVGQIIEGLRLQKLSQMLAKTNRNIMIHFEKSDFSWFFLNYPGPRVKIPGRHFLDKSRKHLDFIIYGWSCLK